MSEKEAAEEEKKLEMAILKTELEVSYNAYLVSFQCRTI